MSDAPFRILFHILIIAYTTFHIMISEMDVKALWGKAAGRCSAPNCHIDLVPLLENSGSIILGEMAHVIGRKSSAARSNTTIGVDDTYDNLILLCPTCHTLVDKAEDDFPESLLHEWKKSWEDQVAGLTLIISNRADLFREIQARLAENNQIFTEWGPTSQRADAAPQSCQAARTWQWRRLGAIVPNNQSIVSLLRRNKFLLTPDEWKDALAFIDHAEFYKQHCIEPADATAYLAFPKQFADLVLREALNG